MRHRPPAIGQRISMLVSVSIIRAEGVSTPRGGAYRLGDSYRTRFVRRPENHVTNPSFR